MLPIWEILVLPLKSFFWNRFLNRYRLYIVVEIIVSYQNFVEGHDLHGPQIKIIHNFILNLLWEFNQNKKLTKLFFCRRKRRLEDNQSALPILDVQALRLRNQKELSTSLQNQWLSLLFIQVWLLWISMKILIFCFFSNLKNNSACGTLFKFSYWSTDWFSGEAIIKNPRQALSMS